MRNKFIFDVDGTLTPSRGKIDKEFGAWMYHFATHQDVYLVTGSDYPKTLEQVGEELIGVVKRVYNCSGNDIWEQGENVYTNEWRIPKEAEAWLREELELSKFPLRTGLHLEDRPGMCNFSVVGRNATLGERKMYVEWDTKMEERVTIASLFKKKFKDLEATVGGETGIDIYPKGADKSQIIKDFGPNERIIFFGDRMDEAGNDYPLAKVNKNGINFDVKNWQDTWNKLNAYIINGS